MQLVHLATTLALFAGAGLATAGHPFTYSIPDGWTDLSPGAPASAFDDVHPGIVREAKSGRFVAFAMDLRDRDGFYEGMNALVRQGALTIDDDLSQLVPALAERYQHEFEAPVDILDASHVDIGAVQAIRVVYDVILPERTLRQVQYLMPGGLDWYTVVTYSTVPAQYHRYRDTFEVSAQATGGVAQAWSFSIRAAIHDRLPEVASAIFLFTFVAFGIHQSVRKKSLAG